MTSACFTHQKGCCPQIRTVDICVNKTIVYVILAICLYQLCNMKQKGSIKEQICGLSTTLKSPLPDVLQEILLKSCDL
jgi:hypothetical protein